MTQVSALPHAGHVLHDLRRSGRSLRVTWHPVENLFVLSMWRSNRCVATCRLSRADAAELVAQLADGLAEPPAEPWTRPRLVPVDDEVQTRRGVAAGLHKIRSKLWRRGESNP